MNVLIRFAHLTTFALICILLPCHVFAGKTVVPEPLQPWKDWVLEDHEESALCAPVYGAPDRYECQWPERLELRLTEHAGEFVFHASLLAEGWLELPGSSRYWPQDINANGQTAVLVEHGGRPSLFLDSGDYTITGRFRWNQLPEVLTLPSRVAFIELAVNGEERSPNFSENQLWIKKTAPQESIRENIELKVYRHFNDQIPFLTTIYLQLRVSGPQREVSFPEIIPQNLIPLNLEGNIPTKIQGSDILLQVRPGNGYSAITLRHNHPVDMLLADIPQIPFWPKEEIWVFQDQPHLRVVKLSGLTSIDPNQTLMPASWKKLPAYLAANGQQLNIETVQRGASSPQPDQISLEKTLWLRSDGYFVAKDVMAGQKNSDWRLEAQKGVLLGRVSINGEDQFITKMQATEEIQGVEIRRGELHLEAESTFAHEKAMSVSGWQTDFQSIRGSIHLPPGWSILFTQGIDDINGTIVQRWNLLALFLLLISTIAAFKLYGTTVAGFTFATFLLTMHDYHFAIWFWLIFYLLVALVQLLPESSRPRQVVTVCKNIVLLLIALNAIPYMVESLRLGIYPQLERVSPMRYDSVAQRGAAPQAAKQRSMPEASVGGLYDEARLALDSVATEAKSSLKKGVLMYDPNAYIQTGPGLPELSFKQFYFSWNRPVSAAETYSIFFLSPQMNLLLAILKSITLSALIILVSGIKAQPLRHYFKTAGWMMLIASSLALTPPSARAADFPSQAMLDELEQRLTAPLECVPECAAIESVELVDDQNGITMQVKVNALAATATPLPSMLDQWTPQNIHFVNATQPYAPKLMRKANTLWAFLRNGRNVISYSIATNANEIQIPFTLHPHNITTSLSNWEVAGLNQQREVASLVLTRVIRSDKEAEFEATKILPPFVQVTRKLTMGLNWTVLTHIKRLSPPGNSISLNIPLLQGENIISESLQVEDGMLKAILDPQVNEFSWESTMAPVNSLVLSHQEGDYTEIWQVEPSSIWHLEHSGLTPVYHKLGDQWLPTWQPRKGESVTLHISRPLGAEGQTLTVERSELQVTPGKHLTDFILKLSLRASHGMQHSIQLPAAVSIQSLHINDKAYPVQTDESGNLLLPVSPGAQNVAINFRQTAGITNFYAVPAIDLRQPTANSYINVTLNRSRWPLLLYGADTVTGPAVLFWSYFLIMLIVAYLLSRSRYSPLRYYQWLLLSIGLAQLSFGATAFVAATIISYGVRKEKNLSGLTRSNFNGIQFLLAAALIISLMIILVSISTGLIGTPDMVIRGNNSSNYLYRWYQDYTQGRLATPNIISLPMLVYRLFMLTWALWISFSLIRFLKWAWGVFSMDGIWQKKTPKTEEGPPAKEDS